MNRNLITRCLIFMLALALPVMCFGADPRVYHLSLGTAISGNSTQVTATGTGTSIFAVIAGPDILRSGASVVQIADTAGEYYGIQITGVTIGQAAKAIGGFSGVTFGFRYKETSRNETAFWDKAQAITVLSNMAFSGNSLYYIPIYPNGFGFIRFEAVLSGVSQIDGYTVEFHCK